MGVRIETDASRQTRGYIMNILFLERDKWNLAKDKLNKLILVLDFVFVIDENSYEVIKDRSGRYKTGDIIEDDREYFESIVFG